MKSRFFIVALFSFMVHLSCGTEGQKPKANSPPAITSVNILPEKPNIQTELSAVVQCQDPDNDPVTNQYQWVKNGEEIVGENSYTLKNGKLKKGDLIQVKVTPSDGKLNWTPFLSPPVKVLNSPPAIQEVRIEPKVAYANDNLKVSVRSSDADGDTVDYTYQWEKNGEILSEDKEVLERGRFKKGDSIIVTVTPDDRESIGKTKKSEPIMIGNSPPIITSSPPNKTDRNIYTYQVTANDPDNDPVIFDLKTAPKGMEINKKTGIIRWEIQKGDQGTPSIEIEASDSEGAKSFQRCTLSIQVR